MMNYSLLKFIFRVQGNSIAGAEGWRENGSNEEMSGRSKHDFHLD
jgi:hypothetical protein